jgi:hypothetical protein
MQPNRHQRSDTFRWKLWLREKYMDDNVVSLLKTRWRFLYEKGKQKDRGSILTCLVPE